MSLLDPSHSNWTEPGVHGPPGSFRYPPELPITERRGEIVAALRDHQVLVVTGETGSGKSTQLPKMCLEAGRGTKGMIGCTQPRRIAAVTLAHRVAQELAHLPSGLVGYKIRFQDRTARNTRIKFMTDGILLAEVQRDRSFRAYDTLIIDEAHERTLNIDFLLGLLKRLLPHRPDLKLVITSATLDPERFSRAFDDAPIIEVSGRTYPVEVWHQPFDASTEDDDVHYIDQAVAAVDLIHSSRAGGGGDVLVFMPTESDIRETVQRLEERRYPNTLVLPLFGRMPAGDQQRVFHCGSEAKIIVATNVAETSITIPRITYVVDTGLARVSHYNPRSRTQSLAVVRISQASAEQRMGRCGRVEAGVCIRLYSREDFLSRPLYTPPEIQRSNLAEVILRMLYLRLGSIQDFPFVDPPSPAAVKDAFGILRELGAVDAHRRLTAMGRTMAQLPLDPRLARMLLEARRLGALAEVVVLVAALSIQDPRERPIEQEQKAKEAHARFRDPRSDFVSLLKIWGAFHGSPLSPPVGGDPSPPGSAVLSSSGPTPVAPSRSQLRKFCREHFLSYRRMREWQDIHEEIWDLLEDFEGFVKNTTPASYEAVHRALLSGYLSHIAQKKEKHVYLGSKNRQLMLFPGSGLFNKGGSWIMSAEQVQTSRLFARTAAVIEPEWIEDVGRHLCRFVYSEPHWEKSRGQVVAYERVVLYGLTIVDRRKVHYGRINPAEAREIFIREGLVAGQLAGRHPFLEHNQALLVRLEEFENRTRRRDLLVDEETLFRFYDERLPDICDAASFNRWARDEGGDAILRMTEADLLESLPETGIEERFPDFVRVGEVDLPLRYAFRPGEENDGVTVTVPLHLLPVLDNRPFEWLVPGLIEEKILHLLKALPKGLRRSLVPMGTTAGIMARTLAFREGDLIDELRRFLQDARGLVVPADCWNPRILPDHLKMRFEVVGPDGTVLGVGRNLEELRPLTAERHEDRLWDAARKKWEKTGLRTWDFGDLPSTVEVGRDALGIARVAYPGLAAEGGSVAVRLFESPMEARISSQGGLLLLYELAFSAELKHFRKDWVFPAGFAGKTFFMGRLEAANERLQRYLLRELFQVRGPLRPDRLIFEETERRLKGRIGAVAAEMIQEVTAALSERETTRTLLQRLGSLSSRNPAVRERLDVLSRELERLMKPDFLEHFSRDQVKALPRYLKGLRVRAERAYAAPEKDRQKAEQFAPWLARYERVREALPNPLNTRMLLLAAEMHQWLEEFKISVFAPEIKPLLRVSPKRLEEKLREWEQNMELAS